MKPVVVMTQTKPYVDERVEIQHLPFVEMQTLSFDTHLLDTHYDWLILTSQNAVRYFLPYMEQLNYRHLAVIGQKTKAFCESNHLDVHFYPSDYSQEGFLKEFPVVSGLQILLPSSKLARPLLQQTLEMRGCQVHKIDLYQPHPVQQNIDEAYNRIHQNAVDAVTFASASAVNVFFQQYQPRHFGHYFAIGKQTANAIKSYGNNCCTAQIQTLESIVDKIIEMRVL
ncbi:uroporphyrinogen-III synthase [Staphylococcus coagulans]|uniref:uroporphyrinogen-III synthase n=1 Tax=Staphylococcus coagulans TaxID=74706 RepID=UPI0028711B55|nr:uroporphyrinogen-III synthase [Staphylococcus coagulans]MDR9832014.1 uroporphyrinogen-III synthase [Staphylococcus coagulans]